MKKLGKYKKITLRFRAENKDIFDMIQKGEKRIETRAATVKYNAISTGNEIVFVCGNKHFKKIVKKASIFPSIGALLKRYRVKDIMPRLHNEKELREAYYSYPGYKEKIKKFGIIAPL